jgi:TonB family protein
MQCSNCGQELRPGTKFCTKCGTLVTSGATAPTPPTRPTVSFGDAPRAPLAGASMSQAQRKSGCGKILLILALVGVVGLAGVGVAIYYGYRFAQEKIKASEAYTVAMNALKENPEVAQRMGEIKETGFPLGNFTENNDGTGAAAYRVSVVGTKMNGDYYVVLTRRQRRWMLVTGKVTLANGDTIDVKTAGPDIFGDNTNANDNESIPPPPPLPPGQAGKIISSGVLNGRAVSLPPPAYPPVAKAARASGTVVVQVTVDESGKVVSARAVAGHPLLQQAAVQAAYQARFTPTLLSGKPVKVIGTINYNFVAQ